MELRSYNVERIFKDCTTCVLGNLVGTRKEELEKYAATLKIGRASCRERV